MLTVGQRTPGFWGITYMGKTMIASFEIDMNDNIGIVYCMPNFMMSLKDLQQDIKICATP